METQRTTNPYHPDVVIFLTLIPIISAFNYYLTYTNIQFNGFLLLTFTLDTVQGYLAWWAVRKFIFALDRKLPIERRAGVRIVVQLFCTIIIGLFVITVLTELVSFLARGKFAPISFYTVDLFIIGIWFIVINGIYFALYFYNRLQQSEQLRKQNLVPLDAAIIVRQGKEDLRIAVATIDGLFVDGEYVTVCHGSGRKYYLDQSLDKVESGLPSALFFRLNRQYIVHRNLISGFRRDDNGKVMVMLNQHPVLPEEIQVSRSRAPAFKSWFRPG